MELPLYHIDAFTSAVFKGNPAAVCPLDDWLPTALMQVIAMENNLPETAFIVRENDAWRIRWFTPMTEVRLCGHATLAAAWVVFQHLDTDADHIDFHSLSGPLAVSRSGAQITLDFPAQPGEAASTPPLMAGALGATPVETRAGDDWLVVLDSAQEVRGLQPDLGLLRQLDRRGVIVTAPGEDCDFVSRFFAPNCGIDEDPVTGSAHCMLTPYWAQRLGKTRLHARQLSARGGELYCELREARVFMSGQAVPYLQGTIHI